MDRKNLRISTNYSREKWIESVPFSQFLRIRVDIFRIFFPFKFTWISGLIRVTQGHRQCTGWNLCNCHYILTARRYARAVYDMVLCQSVHACFPSHRLHMASRRQCRMLLDRKSSNVSHPNRVPSGAYRTVLMILFIDTIRYAIFTCAQRLTRRPA